MEVIYARCCGLDIHKQTVVACVIVPGPERQPRKEVRTFGTMTADLLALSDWLAAEGVTHVALESTGVYWKPVRNALEGSVELLLANARHIKAVPGRKTDVRDCEWIADLLRHGLLKASFVPDGGARPARQGAPAREAPGVGTGAGRALRSPPALLGRAAAGPPRLLGRGHRGSERRSGGAPAPFRGRADPSRYDPGDRALRRGDP